MSTTPFVAVTRHDVDRLNAKRVGGPERGRDVAEVAEPFDDKADGVAPVPNHAPEPPPPVLRDAWREHLDDLGAGQNGAVLRAEGVEVGEPARRMRLVREKRLAVHLHERGDTVGAGEELVDGRRLELGFLGG